MKSELVLIPCITIHPDRICSYNSVNWIPHKPPRYSSISGEEIKKVKFEHLLKSSRSAKGNVSDIAKRKITRALDYLLLLASNKTVTSRFTGRTFQFKIAFITLTLPSAQIHSDNEIKKQCLNQFLIELTKYYKVHNYIWRAEKQKNGNIHFHIIVDKFIDWSEMRDRWNRIINKLGYVDKYREEMENWHKNGFKVRKEFLKTWSEKKQYEAFSRGVKCQWNSPNSTDIHSVRKIINLKSYIRKYLTKSDNSFKSLKSRVRKEYVRKNLTWNINTCKHKNKIRRITLKYAMSQKRKMIQKGRIWGSNQELSKIKGAVTEVDNQIWDELNAVIKHSKCKVFEQPYFSVFFINFADLPKNGGKEIFTLFTQYLLDNFGYSYQLSVDQ